MKKVLIVVVVLAVVAAVFFLKKSEKTQEKATPIEIAAKKIDGFEWSKLASEKMNLYDAGEYCENLQEGGYSDWRLPNIDELRTLIQNHPNTMPGGLCRISEKEDKIVNLDLTDSCKGIDGNNFSKLGDTVRIWSSSLAGEVAYIYRELDAWVVDFENGGVIMHPLADNDNDHSFVRCIRQNDSDACELARKDSPAYSWQRYLDYFPQGMCAEEAKAELKKIEHPTEDELCKKAEKENTRAAWEKYLHDSPQGKCKEKADVVINKFRKIGELEWSNLAPKTMEWNEAPDYCKNLDENGHSDWRIPNIDELRTLIQNNPGTVSGGKCMISEKNGKLNYDDDWDQNCNGADGDNFSKLGDKGWLFSSSEFSENLEYSSLDYNWVVYFDNGRLSLGRKGHYAFKVRCVR